MSHQVDREPPGYAALGAGGRMPLNRQEAITLLAGSVTGAACTAWFCKWQGKGHAGGRFAVDSSANARPGSVSWQQGAARNRRPVIALLALISVLKSGQEARGSSALFVLVACTGRVLEQADPLAMHERWVEKLTGICCSVRL